MGGPARVEVPGVGLAPVGLALYLYTLPASILKLLLFPSLYPIQSGAPRHRVSRIGVLPAPLAKMGLHGQETGLVEPPLSLGVDVPLAQSGYLLGDLLGYLLFGRTFPPASLSPLGWLRRHASCRSSE